MVKIGSSHYFETFVFKCLGEDRFGNPTYGNLNPIETVMYQKSTDSLKAENSHHKMCHKYAKMEIK